MKSLQTSFTRKHNTLMWISFVLLTLIVGAANIGFGSVRIPITDVLRVLCGLDADSKAAKIIFYSRLPHTCAAMLAGAALAVSGAVIQTVLHNPLASPGTIGVNACAGFSVALICAIAPAAQKYSPLVAFAGGLLGVLLIQLLAHHTGASRVTIVLAGVAISNLFSAGIDAVITMVPEALNGVTDFRIGGFSHVTMAQLKHASWMILFSLAAVFSMAQQMDILALGSDVALSLGLSVKPVRFLLLLLAAALAGAAVSFSGLLSFIGLVVPHVMRRLVGENSLPLLVSSAFGGAIFVTLCDLLSRILFAPFEVPVGIVLAFAGAPFFLWLLFRQKGGRQ